MADILERTLAPGGDALSRDLAHYVLTLRLTEADQARMEELGYRAQAACLTESEQVEIDSYIQFSHFLALLKSKARLALRSPGEAA